jgi:hypothetical protein
MRPTNKTAMLSFKIAPESIDYLKHYAQVFGMSTSELCRAAITLGMACLEEDPGLIKVR